MLYATTCKAIKSGVNYTTVFRPTAHPVSASGAPITLRIFQGSRDGAIASAAGNATGQFIDILIDPTADFSGNDPDNNKPPLLIPAPNGGSEALDEDGKPTVTEPDIDQQQQDEEFARNANLKIPSGQTDDGEQIFRDGLGNKFVERDGRKLKLDINGEPTYVRQVDVGQDIGTVRQSEGGGTTSKLYVQTDRAGNLITTFPIPKDGS